MNFFSPRSAAARYARGRPFFHPLVIQRSKEFLSLSEPLPRSLDVGCGTGLSTVALKELARQITGIDASAEMIALAPQDERIKYLVARAESLPFGARLFDLLTMSQVFHWLEKEKFFAEARRVLRARGWLVVYDNYFSDQTDINTEFQAWHKESYLSRYPPPLRAWTSITAEDAQAKGFYLLLHEQVENRISFSPAALVDYFVSQSNVIAAVEGGKEKISDARAWLTKSVKPFFGDRKALEFLFNAPIWFLQRAA